MFRVIILTGIFSTLVESASNRRRLIKQVNSIRGDVSDIKSDVSILFNIVEDINKTIWSNNVKNQKYVHVSDDDEEMVGRKYVREWTIEAFARVLKAFESEKRLNRILKARVDELEENNGRLKEIENNSTYISEALEYYQFVSFQLSNRLTALENSKSDIEKQCSEIQNGLQRQLQNGIQRVEERIFALHKEVVENITSLVYEEELMCKETTHNKVQGCSVDDDDVEREIQITTSSSALKSCREASRSGVYDVYFNLLGATKAIYCDADTDGGDWIVTMRRQDGSVNFNRTWNDYKTGFGKAEGEFWIGNDVLHKLTKSEPMELRVDMEGFNGRRYYAQYERFQVGSEADKYTLTVSGYSGTAGDSMNHENMVHDGMKFSTMDSDNDSDYDVNCALKYSGGWWYSRCFRALPTGPYSHSSEIYWWGGIIWYSLTEETSSLKFIEMKLR